MRDIVRAESVRGRIVGNYETLMAAYGDEALCKFLTCVLTVDEDQGWHVMFYVKHSCVGEQRKRVEFDGLAKAVRYYDEVGQ